ncbi:MAG TPA: XRE family transcriptional regulator [Rhodospirillaceae bacterium]|nr:XRE family transcriptional regulator [Rhodospirillaceae bacterium]
MSVGRQIRAGRGLLRWSAAALAEKAGLTRDTINKIEDDAVQPREGTLKDITRAFDENGVEFTDNFGVRLKPQGIEVLVGPEGLRSFFDGVYEHLREHGGTVFQTGVDENIFSEHLGKYSFVHIKRMMELTQKRHDIKMLSLIKEGDTNFTCSDYAEYRWLPKEMFDPVPFYVYGDSLAIMSFQTIPAPTIVVHNIPAITHAYKKQFETFWNISKEPLKERGQ